MRVLIAVILIVFCWFVTTTWKEFYYARQTMSIKTQAKALFWAVFMTSTTIVSLVLTALSNHNL